MKVLEGSEWTSLVTTEKIGKNLHIFESVESTQIIAHELARRGEPEGTTIIAHHQTSGKGRLGRKWQSPAGAGLWFSVILRPQLPKESVSQITLVSAVAVAKTLTSFGYEPTIKWPNDVLIHGKKVCGILTELHGDTDHVHYIVMGIGINVHQKREDFQEDLRDKATSLYMENSSILPERPELFAQFCKHFESLYSIYLQYGFSPIRTAWEAYAITNERVKVYTNHHTYLGVIRGISDKGVLLFTDIDGKEHEIVSADIELYTD